MGLADFLRIQVSKQIRSSTISLNIVYNTIPALRSLSVLGTPVMCTCLRIETLYCNQANSNLSFTWRTFVRTQASQNLDCQDTPKLGQKSLKSALLKASPKTCCEVRFGTATSRSQAQSTSFGLTKCFWHTCESLSLQMRLIPKQRVYVCVCVKESNISFFWFIESGIVFRLKSAKEVNRSVLQLLKLCPLQPALMKQAQNPEQRQHREHSSSRGCSCGSPDANSQSISISSSL